MKINTLALSVLYACLASALPVSPISVAHNELSVVVERTKSSNKAWDYGHVDARASIEGDGDESWDYGKRASIEDDGDKSWDYGKRASIEGDGDESWDYGKRSDDEEVSTKQSWDYGKRGDDEEVNTKQSWDYGKNKA
ncbi:hypothetical protein BKA67DRAFT_653662 [Truncatella angustata]|jgi:hypothetical protein|uniref:Uncharacterized protein n=1 Tax=Truncatella angustata TaxID=152316 RepID=A0A9P9A4P1_9PEZI|nr:uncharacterized protein BKA67DRAFT_653662 [Truncatella angustata]KAH6660485.1 hypothetical protein BKA67DRAFT_653662 [Truncatella angustata]KAH8194691.1 hypothetical protein TruAng_011146 [Truncatella angustata]